MYHVNFFNQLSIAPLPHLKVWYLCSTLNTENIYFSKPDGLAKWSLSEGPANRAKPVNDKQTPGQAQFEQLVQQVRRHTDFILTAGDSGYPSHLLYTDYPPIIFGKGQAQALLQPQIAIVGSRKPSPHGRQVAYDFAYYLSEKGLFISSGLAYGIDEAAHQGISSSTYHCSDGYGLRHYLSSSK